MKLKSAPLALSVLALLATGCSIIPESKKIDYKSTAKAKTPTLEIPPDLSQVAREDRYSIPGNVGKGSATFSAYAEDKKQAKSEPDSGILPKVENARIERSGSQRWLVVKAPPAKLWDGIKDFWQETGFLINIERPEAGVMETDWAENRAKLPDDAIRNALGKMLDSLYSTGERDKFRTRLEPGAEPGTTDVFISHRAMEEVYTSNEKDQTRWQPRNPDPELEAEMLRRLMVRLGTEEKRAAAAVTVAKAEERAKLNRASDGTGTLELQERFDRAWRRVGLALDRVGFTVEDRDRANGIYFVRYVDPDADSKKNDKSWGSKLAFWKSDSNESKVQYRVYVKDAGNSATVQVLSKEGGADRSEIPQKILSLLYEQLK